MCKQSVGKVIIGLELVSEIVSPLAGCPFVEVVRSFSNMHSKWLPHILYVIWKKYARFFLNDKCTLFILNFVSKYINPKFIHWWVINSIYLVQILSGE